MRMQKGICIELDGDRSVYMLPDGRFVTGKALEGTIIGTETFFESTASRQKGRLKQLALPIVALVAVLMVIVSTVLLPEQEAFGYVQIETNPGIELGVNEKWLVISVRELNIDGKELIEQLDPWEEQSLEKVLHHVLELSVTDETEQVTITTVQEQGDTETVTTVEQITLSAVFANAGGNLRVHMKQANKDQWREAKKQQVPVAELVEENKTFTSPHKQTPDVQPVHNEDKQEKGAEQKGNSDQTEPSKANELNEPAAEPQTEPAAPAKKESDEEHSTSSRNVNPVPRESQDKDQNMTSNTPAAKGNQAKSPVEKPASSSGTKGIDKENAKETPAKKPAAPVQDKVQEKSKVNGQNKHQPKEKPKEKPKEQPKEKEKSTEKPKEQVNKAHKEQGKSQENNKQTSPGSNKVSPETKETPESKATSLPDQAAKQDNPSKSKNSGNDKGD